MRRVVVFGDAVHGTKDFSKSASARCHSAADGLLDGALTPATKAASKSVRTAGGRREASGALGKGRAGTRRSSCTPLSVPVRAGMACLLGPARRQRRVATLHEQHEYVNREREVIRAARVR